MVGFSGYDSIATESQNPYYIMSFLPFLHRAANRENLNASDAQRAMELILSGDATTAQIAGFLVALRMKGETPDEILGFACAMRGGDTSRSPGSCKQDRSGPSRGRSPSTWSSR